MLLQVLGHVGLNVKQSSPPNNLVFMFSEGKHSSIVLEFVEWGLFPNGAFVRYSMKSALILTFDSGNE